MKATADDAGTTPDVPFVEHIACNSAEGFLLELRPSHERWRSDPFNPAWLFRGQHRNDPPKAAAWREPTSTLIQAIRPEVELVTGSRTFKFDKGKGGPFVFANLVQNANLSQQKTPAELAKLAQAFELSILTEFCLAHRFWEIAEQAGHTVEPPWWLDQFVSDPIACIALSLDGKRESVFECSLFAVAQHHGIPTRLIDWTTHPLIAAFFAAYKGSEKRQCGPDESMTVWAFRRSWLQLGNAQIVEFRPPRFLLPRFARQEGRFLWQPNAHEYFPFHGQWPALEDTLQEMWEEAGPALRRKRGTPLVRVTLDSSHCDELLSLLWYERQTRAHLMADLDKVEETLSQLISSNMDASARRS